MTPDRSHLELHPGPEYEEPRPDEEPCYCPECSVPAGPGVMPWLWLVVVVAAVAVAVAWFALNGGSR